MTCRREIGRALAALPAAVTLLAGLAQAGADAPAPGANLDLAVSAVVARHPPYAAFCRRQPAECDLSGPSIDTFSAALMAAVTHINAATNAAIRFTLDRNQYDVEEYWALPRAGRGDCEDLALEKRARLVRLGLARGALRVALVTHRRLLISHAVLTWETTAGTFVLDSIGDEVVRWDLSPYNFEARERPDGRWERFDQTQWR